MSHSFSLSFVMCIIFWLISPSISILDVDTVTITISPDSASGTDETVFFTLWWNHSIYKFPVAEPQTGTSYTTDLSPYIIGSSLCNSADTKMRIVNRFSGAVVISKIQVNTTDGAWYGVDAYCHEGEYPEGSSDWDLDDNLCLNGRAHLNRICVDTDECTPYQQMVYFDLDKPNQWDSTAAVKDASDATVEIVTCPPSQSPTTASINNVAIASTGSFAAGQKDTDSQVVLALAITGILIGICVLCVGLFIAYKCHNSDQKNIGDDHSGKNKGFAIERVVSASFARNENRLKSAEDIVHVPVEQKSGNNNVHMDELVQPEQKTTNHTEDDRDAHLEPDEFVVNGDDDMQDQAATNGEEGS